MFTMAWTASALNFEPPPPIVVVVVAVVVGSCLCCCLLCSALLLSVDSPDTRRRDASHASAPRGSRHRRLQQAAARSQCVDQPTFKTHDRSLVDRAGAECPEHVDEQNAHAAGGTFRLYCVSTCCGGGSGAHSCARCSSSRRRFCVHGTQFPPPPGGGGHERP